MTHEYDSRPGHGKMGLDYMNDFLEAWIDAPTVLNYVATLDEAIRALRVLDAVHKSAEIDEWVWVDSYDR